jgi:hypothetical protein
MQQQSDTKADLFLVLKRALCHHLPRAKVPSLNRW